MTIVEGIDEHDIDVRELTKELKAKCACGGTAKKGQIELQGDHKKKVKEVLANMANLEQATKIKGRDPRVFQDGIYLISKE